MPTTTVICGAGIAGVAAAYHLAARHGVTDIVLVDEREPLTLTSDKGTAGYRNWWPGPDNTMLRLVSRSIDLLEDMAAESKNAFRLNRRGYLFLTADDAGVERLRTSAREVSAFGMGLVREGEPYSPPPAEGYEDQPVGADLLLGDEIRYAFPYLAPDVKGALHVRRAGWVNPVALGGWMLRRALGAGVTFVHDKVTEVTSSGGRVRGVKLASGRAIEAERVVLAAGPLLQDAARMIGVELPLIHELHAKATLHDPHGAVRRDAAFLIWNDPVTIDWSAGEREEFPGGVHIRPVDVTHGDELFLIWTYHTQAVPPTWPLRFDPRYGEIVLRGAARMVPGLAAYIGGGTGAFVDGGYYCKTPENRPLVGPIGPEGAFVIGALSGSGLMASHAMADLLAAHMTGGRLPDYAPWFLPSRYDDAAYRAKMATWNALMGQL